MEHLVVGQVRTTDVVAVEEDGEVGQTLVDPGQLARIGVVLEQMLEFVGDDALVQLAASDRIAGLVADPVLPVEGVDDHDVHVVVGEELGGEVAGRVGRLRAVVVRIVGDVVDERDQGVAWPPLMGPKCSSSIWTI